MDIIGAGAGRPPAGGPKSPHVIDGGDQTFMADVIEPSKSVPVIVDFWATWCGPCRMLSPIVDAVASEHPEVKVGKINVDEQPELAQQFGIMSIPTLIVMKDGKVVEQAVGARGKADIAAMLERHL